MAGPCFKYKRLSNQALMETIKRYLAGHGYSPTIREMARITDTGVATVRKYLKDLIYSCYVKGEATAASIQVVKDYD